MIGGSLSSWELMPSYSHGLITADVTGPPDHRFIYTSV